MKLLITAGGGILVGFLIGYIVTHLLSEKKYNILRGHTAEVSIASVLGAYVIAQHFGFSGFMATFIIPAALAGMIISLKINNAPIISAVTFMAIIITLTFQASTAKYVAKLLKLEVNVN